MNDLWYDPIRWAWLPGTAFGVLAGLWGSMAGMLAPMGRAKALIVGAGVVLLVAGLGLLIAGVVGLVVGQPFQIWWFLMLPGLLSIFVLGPLMPVMLLRYRQAEARKMKAGDLG